MTNNYLNQLLERELREIKNFLLVIHFSNSKKLQNLNKKLNDLSRNYRKSFNDNKTLKLIVPDSDNILKKDITVLDSNKIPNNNTESQQKEDDDEQFLHSLNLLENIKDD